MRTRVTTLAMLGVALAAHGCWGDIVGLYPDSGPDGIDTGDPPVEPELIEGGGTGGGAIAGRVNLFVLDEATRAPIAGARIQLRRGDLKIHGLTDADGLAVLEEDGLTGPVEIHMLADGHVAESLHGLGASNATLLLRPLAGVPAPPTATISGSVSGFDLIPEPDPDEYKIAVVFWSSPFDRLLAMRDPGFDPRTPPGVEVVAGSGDDTYEVTVPAGAGRLYALGGLVRTWNTPDDGDDTIEWTHLGLVDGIDVEAGEALIDVDLTFDTALLLTAMIKFAPGSVNGYYGSTAAYLGLDLGPAGAIWFAHAGVSDVFSFPVPNYYGEFADGEIIVGAIARQVVDEEEAGGTVAHMPIAYKIDYGMENWEDWGISGYNIDGSMAQAALGLDWDGEVFSCFPPTGFTLNQVVLIEEETGAELWRLTGLGDFPVGGVAIPDLPADWGWDGVPAVGVRARIWATRMMGDVDVDDMAFDDFPRRVVDVSVNEALFE